MSDWEYNEWGNFVHCSRTATRAELWNARTLLEKDYHDKMTEVAKLGWVEATPVDFQIKRVFTHVWDVNCGGGPRKVRAFGLYWTKWMKRSKGGCK